MASKNSRRSAGKTPSQTGKNGYQTNSQSGGFRPAYTPSSNRRDSGVHYAPSNYGTGGEYSRNGGQYSVKAKHGGRGKKIALAIVLVVVVLLAGAGAAAAWYVNSLNQEIAIDNPEEAAAVDEALTPTVSNEPFYLMIIGSDSRGDDSDRRSDTNIVARVDLSTGTVTLISIPRDTAITIDGYGTQKFNAAYSYGGAAGAIKAASNLLGVNISHYVEIDFDGATQFIDALGGVTVDVPMPIEDANAGDVTIDSAGVQTLDGEHALVFARSRSYVSGDFQRTTNQRLLIEAVVNKVMAMPATDIPGVVQKAAKCITTDMSVTDIIGYAQSFQKAGKVTMYSAMIPSYTAEQNGISYVVCNTTLLTKMMAIVDQGGDPSTVATDSTVSSSAEAAAEGAESTPVYEKTP